MKNEVKKKIAGKLKEYIKCGDNDEIRKEGKGE